MLNRYRDPMKQFPLRNFGLKPNFRICLGFGKLKATHFTSLIALWRFGIAIATALPWIRIVDAA